MQWYKTKAMKIMHNVALGFHPIFIPLNPDIVDWLIR
jgi:hypothetical protein